MSCVLNPFMRCGPEIAGSHGVSCGNADSSVHGKMRLLRNALFILHHRRRNFDVGFLLLVSKKSPSTV